MPKLKFLLKLIIKTIYKNQCDTILNLYFNITTFKIPRKSYLELNGYN